jgi:hypothetical protein
MPILANISETITMINAQIMEMLIGSKKCTATISKIHRPNRYAFCICEE